jgi:basic amino acid/polyamine antiporter, APA family
METNIKAGMPLHPAELPPLPGEPIEAKLGLWDAVSIIVGIIIGVGIFETPPRVFDQVPHPAIAILVWVLGGMLALIGALCFAELASAYPRSGGEYVYLTRAFGPMTGFLFAWAQLTVIRSGSVAALAYIFGFHAARLFDLDNASIFLLAGVSVFLLTAINIVGVRMGTGTQHVLTIAKVLGLLALVVVGLGWGSTTIHVPEVAQAKDFGWFAGAMIIVLWTYAGWHEAAYIVSEAKNRTRNIPVALILGTAIVTLIYVLVNLAYLFGLDFAGAQKVTAAEDLIARIWPGMGTRVMDIFIMISALGAMNGMIFTTARIFSEFGRDHRIFNVLSHWSKRMKTPVRALAIQGVVCLAMIGGIWLANGDKDMFDTAVALTAAVFWVFFCLTGIALFVLRRKDPDTPRPFRVPGYPVVPFIFCCSCAFMIVGTVLYDPEKSLIGVLILMVGLPFYFLPPKLRHQKPVEDLQPLAK